MRFESSLAAMKHDFEKAILELHKAWNQFPTTAKHVEFEVQQSSNYLKVEKRPQYITNLEAEAAENILM